MKNFIFVIITTFLMCFASCGNKVETTDTTIDSIDTVVIDSLDSITKNTITEAC